MTLRLLLSALLLLPLLIARAAPPANDDYANAIDLGGTPLPLTLAGTTVEATLEPGEYREPLTVAQSFPHSSVWYRWTAPASGWVGATLPQEMSLDAFIDGPGVPGSGRLVRSQQRYNPAVPFEVAADQVLWLRVAARYAGEAAPFSLQLTAAAPPNNGPGWDAYADIPGGPSVVLHSNNIGATVAPGEVLPPGANTGSTVYFQLYAHGSFPCEITTAGSALDTVLAVYTSDQQSLVAWNDDAAPGDLSSRVTFTPALGGVPYIIQVGGWQAAQGSFQLNVNYTLPPPPANDHRAGAAGLTSAAGISWPVQTHSATSEPGEVTPGGMRRTLWYRWTAPAGGAYKLDGNYGGYSEPPAFCVFREVPGMQGLPRLEDLVTQGLPAVFRAAVGEKFLFSIGGMRGYLGYEYEGTVTLSPLAPQAVDNFDGTVAGPLRHQTGTSEGLHGPWTYDDSRNETGDRFSPSQEPNSFSAVSTAGSLGRAAGRRVTVPSVNGTLSLSRGLVSPPGNSNTVTYFSFLISTDSTAANAFAGVRLITASGPMIFIGKPGAGATGKWVIENVGGAGQESQTSTAIVPGRTARLVVRASFGAVDEFRLYTDVPPDMPESAYIPSIKTGSYGRIYYLGLFSNAACEVDDVRMGTTWESVTLPTEDTPVIFNEAFTAAAYDFNEDGAASAVDDSYCELVNRSAQPHDLSGQSVWLDERLHHTFPPGTVLRPQQALVIFAGGQPAEGATAAFGNAWVQRANGLPPEPGYSATLHLRSTASTGVAVLASFSHGHNWFPTTRWPELSGNSWYVWPHNDTLFVPGGHPGSPGQRVDLAPWLPLTQALAASISRGSVVEGAGWNAATLTVSRPGSLTEPLTVQIRSSHPALVNTPPDYAVIPAGEPAVTVPLGFYADFTENPNQIVTLTAIGSGFLNGTATVTVLESARHIYINEINAQSNGGGGGTDFNEFIELYDGGLGFKSLHDFIVVLFDADAPDDGAYRVIDLQGRQTSFTGFFVIDSNVFPELTSGWLTNGGGAVAIYKKRTGGGMGGGGPAIPPFYDFPPGAPPVVNANLVDAIHHVSYDDPDLALVALFTPGGVQADEGPLPPGGPGQPNLSTAHCPDAQSPLNSGAFRMALPTPGSSNLTYPGFSTWSSTRGVTSMTADEDHDGLDNLLEYALGGIPADLTGDTDTSSQQLLPGPLENPFGQLRMQFYKGPQAGFDPRLRWEIEASTDMIHWSTRDMVIIYEDCGSLTASYIGTTPRVQLRLRVVHLP